MAKARLVKDQDKVIIRLPEGMRDRLKAAAAEKDISLNAEMVSRLEFSFQAQMALPDVQRLARDRRSLIELNTEALDVLKEAEGTMLKQMSVIRFVMNHRDRFPDLAAMIEQTGLYDDRSEDENLDDTGPVIDLHEDDEKAAAMIKRAPGVPPTKR